MKSEIQQIDTPVSLPEVKYSVTESALSELREQSELVLSGDVTTADGLKAVKSAVSNVVSTRTGVEKHRKELKSSALEWGRKVDAEAKRITGELLKIEEPLKNAVAQETERRARIRQEKAEREAKRVEEIKEKIASFRNWIVECQNKPSEFIREKLVEYQTMDVNESDFREFLPQALAAKQSAEDGLAQALDMAVEREQEVLRMAEERERLEAEQELLRKEKAKRKAEAERLEQERREREKQREEELAKERAALEAERAEIERQRAEAEAERKKVEDEREAARAEREREERERLEREQREKERAEAEAAEVERKRIAEEEAEKQRKSEEAARLADENRLKSIHLEIEDDLATHINPDADAADIAFEVAEALMNGEIRHLKFNPQQKENA